jgi:hypothetical protein
VPLRAESISEYNTKLNEIERQYLEKRISEETTAMLQLAPSHQAGDQ